ncbi:MAG TPA: MFS transporter [Burkholderiales bacterium]|nr:MFS transporter [Burkholderiales bacterium]
MHVLRQRDFRLFLGGRFCAALALQMQSVAIGWYLYDLTSDPLVLGYAGLAVFLPIFVFSLPAGDVADRVDRRAILGAMHLTQAICAALFIALTATATASSATWPFFAVLALSGTARAFSGPAVQSFTPFLVPREQFANAVGWSSSANQTATVLGPALGGGIYLFGPGVVFAACLAMSLAVAAAMIAIRTRVVAAAAAGTTALSRAVSGIVYLRRQPVVLGAISLDLFAVLLGGITALLPIYARDILGVGPDGMGLMRSSIAVGGVGTALLLANLPSWRLPHAGRAMFLAVALFGVAVLFFGLSASFAASLIALAVMGAADMVSVFVRSTVVQLATPDAMRGRISALHMLSVNAANELGEFRAGIVAAWLGAVPAVLLGGIGSLVVVGVWAYFFPELRRIDRLADVSPRS